MRPGIWVSFFSLSLGIFQLRHHMIVTYGKHKYSFVPHFHAILHFSCFWTFFSFLSPPTCLSFWIFIQAPLSIVSFCVRYVFNFHLTDGEELWQFCTHMVQYFILIHIAFLGYFDSYLPFGFQFLAWDHLNIIYCYLASSPWVLVVTPLDIFKCEMDGASK